MSRLTAPTAFTAPDANAVELGASPTQVKTGGELPAGVWYGDANDDPEQFIAPRVIKYPGLSNGQLAGLIVALMAGLGLLYLFGCGCLALWRLLGWMWHG